MSFAVEFIDGPHRGEVRFIDGDFESPEDLSKGFDLDGVHYAFIGGSGPGGGGGGRIIDRAKLPDRPVTDFAYYLTKDPVELFHWWKSLSPGARSALSANPDGPVPSEFLTEVIHSGQLVIGGPYWRSVESAPGGFFLPDRIQQWIADHPLRVP